MQPFRAFLCLVVSGISCIFVSMKKHAASYVLIFLVCIGLYLYNFLGLDGYVLPNWVNAFTLSLNQGLTLLVKVAIILIAFKQIDKR